MEGAIKKFTVAEIVAAFESALRKNLLCDACIFEWQDGHGDWCATCRKEIETQLLINRMN